MKDQAQWTAPSPLWPEAAASQNAAVRRALRRPAVLRFATDTFMDDFLALLEHDPARLGEYLAAPETWRAPSNAPGPVERAPEFVKKLGNFRLAARRTLKQAAGLAPAKVLSTGAKLAGGTSLVSTNTVAANTLALSTAVVAQKPLKLYQPAHQRFYLVAGCLVCRVPGLPDKTLDTAREERVSYVIRRMYQRRDGDGEPVGPIEEYGFVVTAQGNGWQKVSGALELVENEERLPLFNINFTERDGRRRRLFAGMIPVGKREAYMGAGTYTPTTNGTSAPNATTKTARKIHFRMQVTEPWKNILRVADDAKNTLQTLLDPPDDTPEPEPEEIARLKRDSRTSAQVTSWLVLLDFAKFLKQYAPIVWTAVRAGNKNNLVANSPQEKLYDALESMKPTTTAGGLVPTLRAGTSYTVAQVAASMRDALAKIGTPEPNDATKFYWESRLDAVETPYNREANPIDAAWPDFLYPLADLEKDVPLPPEEIGPPPADDAADETEELPDVTEPLDLAEKQTLVDKLAALVARALPKSSIEPAPAVPLAARPVLDTREGTFLIRFVYERPFCGPLDPPLLSEASAEFQMAGFFDPDAPARPIRIALPVDVSPAGLRKFDKNTAFMISDQLCGQMNRLKGITFADLVLSVLPWPFHKDLSVGAPEIGPCRDDAGLSLGMICSLSIPIITICALILLFIIVLLLDLIFRWIPFFIMCFPLPGFKAKRS